MLSTIFRFVLLVVALTLGAAAKADLVLLEEAAEFQFLEARVGPGGEGFINLRACDHCVTLQLRVTAATRLRINGKSFPISELNNGRIADGTAFYDPDRLRVTRIDGTR